MRGLPPRPVAAVLLALVLLLGCQASNVGRDYALDPDRDVGLAVVSLTIEQPPRSAAASVSLRGLDSDYDSSITIVAAFVSADWGCHPFRYPTLIDPCGRLAVIELEAGRYEFYDLARSSVDMGSEFDRSAAEQGITSGATPGIEGVTDRTRGGFSKVFSVEAGKVKYLGNLHVVVTSSNPSELRSESGMGYELSIWDARRRDLSLLFEKHPLLDRDDVVVELLPE